jgi:hypothetical protein
MAARRHYLGLVAGLGIMMAIYASDLPDVHQVAGLKKRPGVTLLAATDRC